ncbi:MAG: hypothetical protein RRY33_03215 [Alistipes sp.]
MSANNDKPTTPEEAKWRASVYAPERLRKSLKRLYILLIVWSIVVLAWVIAICIDTENFNWWNILVMAGGYSSVIIGIINTKRLYAGKKPF